MTGSKRANWSGLLDALLTWGRWALLVIAVIVAVALVVGAFLLSPTEFAAAKVEIGALRLQGVPAYWVAAAITVAALLLYWRVATMFRNFFRAIARGDAFTEENVARLNALGGLLVAVKLIAMGGSMISSAPAPRNLPNLITTDFPDDLIGNPPSWLVIIAVFALAEAFRQGAKLHAESQLTV